MCTCFLRFVCFFSKNKNNACDSRCGKKTPRGGGSRRTLFGGEFFRRRFFPEDVVAVCVCVCVCIEPKTPWKKIITHQLHKKQNTKNKKTNIMHSKQRVSFYGKRYFAFSPDPKPGYVEGIFEVKSAFLGKLNATQYALIAWTCSKEEACPIILADPMQFRCNDSGQLSFQCTQSPFSVCTKPGPERLEQTMVSTWSIPIESIDTGLGADTIVCVAAIDTRCFHSALAMIFDNGKKVCERTLVGDKAGREKQWITLPSKKWYEWVNKQDLVVSEIRMGMDFSKQQQQQPPVAVSPSKSPVPTDAETKPQDSGGLVITIATNDAYTFGGLVTLKPDQICLIAILRYDWNEDTFLYMAGNILAHNTDLCQKKVVPWTIVPPYEIKGRDDPEQPSCYMAVAVPQASVPRFHDVLFTLIKKPISSSGIGRIRSCTPGVAFSNVYRAVLCGQPSSLESDACTCKSASTMD